MENLYYVSRTDYCSPTGSCLDDYETTTFTIVGTLNECKTVLRGYKEKYLKNEMSENGMKLNVYWYDEADRCDVETVFKIVKAPTIMDWLSKWDPSHL